MLEIDEIIFADCNEAMKTLPGGCIDLVVTDPPYGVNYATNRRLDKNHSFCSAIENDDSLDWLPNHIAELARIMRPNSAALMFTSWQTIDVFMQAIKAQPELEHKATFVWHKNSWTAGDLFGAPGCAFENILLFTKGRVKWRGDHRPSNVLEFNRVTGNNQMHQNQKPLDLIQYLIELYSDVDDIVFDGFAGSGTTAVAARTLGRHYLCYEIDHNNCIIARQRVQLARRDDFRNAEQSAMFADSVAQQASLAGVA